MTYMLWRKKGEAPSLNANSKVYPGGTLYYYNETTLTPLTVYKNGHDSGATPWGTSVTLDAAGKLTDALFVGETNFKEILKDAAGATIFERDRYPGSPAAPADPDAARPLTPVTPGSSSTITLTASDVGKLIDADDGSNSITVVLPDPSEVANGEWIAVRKLSASNSVTIDNTYTEESWVLSRQYDRVVLVSNGVDAWNLFGFTRPQLKLNAMADKLLGLAADPNADRFLIWDDSAGDWVYLGPGASADRLFFYDHSALSIVPLEIDAGLNLSGTTLGLHAGAVVQSIYAEYATNADITTVIPQDDTIPQNTEGDEIFSQAITLKKATNKVRATFRAVGEAQSSQADDPQMWGAALFRDSNADAIAATPVGLHASNVGDTGVQTCVLVHEEAPGSVGPFTYAIRVGPGTGDTLRLNGHTGARYFGGVVKATLILEEIQV